MRATTPPIPRKDAVRNRSALLAAARAVFEQEGLGAPLENVAATAGLSRASLARHFRSREDLVAALWEADVLEVEAVSQAAQAAPDGFLRLFDVVVGWQVDRRAVRPTTGQLERGDLHDLVQRLTAAVASTLPSAHRAGCARPGLQVDDVMLAIAMCADVITDSGDRPTRAARWISARRLIVPGLVEPQWIADHPQALEHPTEN
jgi:AcrR family transcriptional regulator